MDEATHQELLTTNRYWYRISTVCTQIVLKHSRHGSKLLLIQAGEVDTGQPFLNGAIIDILKEEYFDGWKSLYKLYLQEFQQHLPTKDGGKDWKFL